MSALARFAEPRPLLVLTVVTLGLFVGVNTLDFTGTVPHFRHMTNGQGILDMQPFYGPTRAHELLDLLGPAGRRQYAALLVTFDVGFPAVVALFLRSAMSALYGAPGPRGLRLVPWIGLAFDYAENIACGVLVATFPNEPAAVATMAGCFTAAKNVSYVTEVVTVLVGVGMALRRALGSSAERRA